MASNDWVYWCTNSVTSSTNTDSGSSWDRWNNTSVTSTANATYDNSPTTATWYYWCDMSKAGTDVSVSGTWEVWSDNHEIVYYDFATTKIELPKLTTEQVRARNAQVNLENEWRKHLAEELRKAREAAEVKAQELLLDLIGEDQIEVYRKTGRLFVKGRKYDYIVKRGGGVARINKDKVSDLCIHLTNRHKYPDTDNVIAMKLAIEGSENKFLKLANGTNRERDITDLDEARAACR